LYIHRTSKFFVTPLWIFWLFYFSDLKSKAPITFSITGILSTGTSSTNHRNTSTQSPQQVYPHPSTEANLSLLSSYQHQRATDFMKTRPSVVTSDQFYGRREVIAEDEYYAKYLQKNNRSHHHHNSLGSELLRYASPRSSASSFEECQHRQERRMSDNASPPKIFRPNSPEEIYNFYKDKSPLSCPKKFVRTSPPPLSSDHHEVIMTSSHNGRFRPPPFFETVIALRKRLYILGRKVFPVDEPPSDRNVHKLWRSMEKHKVNYVSVFIN